MDINNPNNVEFTISEGWCPTRKEKLYEAWQHNKNGDGYWVKIAITSSLNEILERVKSEAKSSNKIMTIEWRNEICSSEINSHDFLRGIYTSAVIEKEE